MRQLMTTLFILLMVLGATAQTEKGTMLLGANSNFGFASISLNDIEGVDESDLPDMTSTETEFSLNGGYFVMDGLALGLVIDYSSSKTEIEGAGDQETSLMTYGFMARYYIGESGLWGQGSYSMGTQDNGGDDTNISGITLSVGYAWYLSDNISINPTIGYNMMNSEANDVEMKMGGLAGSIGIAIHL